jgi:hypothetical protein
MRHLMLAAVAVAATASAPASADFYYGFGFSGFEYHSLTVNGTGSISTGNAGWFNSNGDHQSYNQNYIAGDLDGTQYRNFFVFDAGGGATSLTLNVANPYVWSFGSHSSLTYTLYDVSSSIDSFSDYSGATGIFADLGTGKVYGHVTFSSQPGSVSVVLNQAAVDAFNAAGDAGQPFAIGGVITANDGVPEASTWAMLIAGFGLVGAAARRRKATAVTA